MRLMNTAPFARHITVEQPSQVLDLLLAHLPADCPLSKQQLKQVMQKGAVWLTPSSDERFISTEDARQHSRHTQRLRRAKKQLKTGDCLHLYYDHELLSSEPPQCELISDQGDYSVWFKPCGTLSQGSKWSDHCTITRWAEKNLLPERPAFLVHRLDRATSGLILIAHSKQAAQKLSQLFERRQIDKRYQAQVHGEFSATPVSVTTAIDDRAAVSHFTRLTYNDAEQSSLIDVKIETGRKHQIRKHLVELGTPIIGDRLHGIEQQQRSGLDLRLCAYELKFECPFKQSPQHFQLDQQLAPWIQSSDPS